MANVIESGEDAIQFRTPSMLRSHGLTVQMRRGGGNEKHTSGPPFPSVPAPKRNLEHRDGYLIK